MQLIFTYICSQQNKTFVIMTSLEKFYNERIKATDGRFPAFNELNDEAKQVIRKSTSFAFYKLDRDFEALKTKARNLFKL